MKFGLKQIGREAPEWLSRLSDALVLLLGAFAIYTIAWPDKWISPEMKNFLGATATFIVAVVKAIELFSGKKENQQP